MPVDLTWFLGLRFLASYSTIFPVFYGQVPKQCYGKKIGSKAFSLSQPNYSIDQRK